MTSDLLNKNKKITIIVAIIIGIAVLCIGSATMNYNELPSITVANLDDSFDGKAAYEYEEKITSDFQYRIFGSAPTKTAGLYVAEQFNADGLEVTYQDFKSQRPAIDKFYGKFDIVENNVNLLSDSISTLTEYSDGVNVIGMSKGESNEAILIGAHRDMANSIEGAEDNASGTAVLLELAKNLTSTPHYYTYIFVSFDGEEMFQRGSNYFANTYGNLGDIQAAFILDQVGYKLADTYWMYETNTGVGQPPLWLHAATNDVMELIGCQSGYYSYEFMNEGSMKNLFGYAKSSAFARSRTDSEPFVDKGIAAIGVKAISSADFTEAVTHCDADTIANISEQTLKMSGDLIVNLVKTMEENKFQFSGDLNSTDYILVGNRYLPAMNLIIIRVVFGIVFLLLLGIALLTLKENFKFAVIKREVILGGVTLVSAGILFLLNQPVLKSMPVISVLLIFFICLILGINLTVRKVKVTLTQAEVYAKQLVVLLISFGLIWISNKFTTALYIILLPVFLVAILFAFDIKNKIVKIILFLIWTIIHCTYVFNSFNTYMFNLFDIRFIALCIINLFIYITMLTSFFNQTVESKE